MNRTSFARLTFSPKHSHPGDHKQLCDGLSSVVQIGNSLWVTNDEAISLEQLTLMGRDNGGHFQYGDHQHFSLSDYLELPVPPQRDGDFVEADVEGLAYDEGYLWLVGSHSLKRGNATGKEGNEEGLKRLARIRNDGNRYLIARIPVVEKVGTYSLQKKVERHGQRRAGQLHGDSEGNDLTKSLRQDKHLHSFLAIPGKDNGLDIEGLAIANGRLFIGLRGPVLRGWAVILEVELREDHDSPGTLKLKNIGPNDQLYRKHFVHLGGLGIRDLCVYGDDLLILAGPTMNVDGPVAILRWPGGTDPKEESLVPSGELELVMDLPYGICVDHAEGLTLFAPEDGEPLSLLVVYDSSSQDRRNQAHTTEADIFALFDRPQ
jgi:Protein of unknown function (DUF3616)